MRKFRRQDKERFFYFCVLLFVLGFAIISIVWSTSKTYYSNAYTPVVQEANVRHELERQQKERRTNNGKSSEQPRAPGFSEADIEKSHGDRYATY